MKNKIIIIGKRSFVGNYLSNYLKNKLEVQHISFNQFLKKSNLSKIDFIINCSIKKKYISSKYNIKFDLDYQISKKIKKYKNCKLIFLSSRKIYKPQDNISENGKLLLRENYSKNKYISEEKLKKTLPNRVLVLRISNLIGNYNLKQSRLHKTFLDFFTENIRKGIIFENKKIYKDFLPINVFSQIILKLIKNNKTGIFNVSIGKKVYLNKIVGWLNYYNRNKVKIMELTKTQIKILNRESFFLNNDKLIKSINIKIRLIDLKKECLRISKKLFNEKKK